MWVPFLEVEEVLLFFLSILYRDEKNTDPVGKDRPALSRVAHLPVQRVKEGPEVSHIRHLSAPVTL